MRHVSDVTAARGVDLLHQLRAAVPDRAADYIGLLNDRDPMSIVEAFLFVRRAHLRLPSELYEAVQEQMIEVLEAV